MSPDLNVTTTARGPQVSMPSKFGGPNTKPNMLFDIGQYMLSDWPMMQIQAGVDLDHCLKTIRYH